MVWPALGNIRQWQLWIRIGARKQKGVGIKPTPNYYQTSGFQLLHISASITGKQKGLGNFPSPDYYQTVVTQYYIKLKLLVVTIVKRRVAL